MLWYEPTIVCSSVLILGLAYNKTVEVFCSWLKNKAEFKNAFQFIYIVLRNTDENYILLPCDTILPRHMVWLCLFVCHKSDFYQNCKTIAGL